MPTRLKVCCIASREEAALAIRYGASSIGLVSAMPSGPGPIDEALIAEIAVTVPPPVATFLLTCATTAAAIADQVRRCRTSTIQLVDAVAPSVYGELRLALPGVKLVQVIHVQDENSIAEAQLAAAQVDALLLDSGNPKLAVKELGGTGRAHDWRLSRRIVETVRVPVFLAGGLNPANVREAMATVRPFGIDVCSGLRSDGRLDEAKLAPFAATVLAS